MTVEVYFWYGGKLLLPEKKLRIPCSRAKSMDFEWRVGALPTTSVCLFGSI
jgi:hypothetical protein